MQTGRSRAFLALFLIGVLLWLAGAADVVPDRLLALAFLLCGSLQAVAAGFLLLTARASGRREHGTEESVWFCSTCGAGVASVGLALSPLTGWLSPAIIFATGGVALILWAPQALGRERARG